jgi:hypothetical protein
MKPNWGLIGGGKGSQIGPAEVFGEESGLRWAKEWPNQLCGTDAWVDARPPLRR